MPKSFHANRVNVYLDEQARKDLDFLSKTMSKRVPTSRSRVIRALIEQETARVMSGKPPVVSSVR